MYLGSMIFLYLFCLFFSLVLVTKGADLAIKFSVKLAESFRLSKYIIGFLIVAIISVLPEAFISINSAIEGVPAFGLGTLFGSNVADLTLVFALMVLSAGRDINVRSKIIKNRYLYALAMLTPLFFGFNGHYSRLEGVLLLVIGFLFYFYTINGHNNQIKNKINKFKFSNILWLVCSMALLLLGANLTVKYGIETARLLRVNPLLIGMFVVALGTTLPELMFSVRAIQKKNDDLAMGDILGTVLADATILVGVMAVIKPFVFDPAIVYVSGFFMFLSTLLLFRLIKTDKTLTQGEALLLIIFYIIFVATELLVNK